MPKKKDIVEKIVKVPQGVPYLDTGISTSGTRRTKFTDEERKKYAIVVNQVMNTRNGIAILARYYAPQIMERLINMCLSEKDETALKAIDRWHKIGWPSLGAPAEVEETVLTQEDIEAKVHLALNSPPYTSTEKPPEEAPPADKPAETPPPST